MRNLKTILREKWGEFKTKLSKTEYAENISTIAAQLKDSEFGSLLEIGCYPGRSTKFFLENLKVKKFYAIDCKEELLGRAKAMGVDAKLCDLERDRIPFQDNFFDLVVANQVFEHLKNIYSPLSEIHRVLKPGGILVFSVPNLASFHSRLLLLFGKSPTQIRLWGDHVRGFTIDELKPFLLYNGLFSLCAEKGTGYYPLPPVLSRFLSKIFPNAAVYITFFLKKNESPPRGNWEMSVKESVHASNFIPN